MSLAIVQMRIDVFFDWQVTGLGNRERDVFEQMMKMAIGYLDLVVLRVEPRTGFVVFEVGFDLVMELEHLEFFIMIQINAKIF